MSKPSRNRTLTILAAIASVLGTAVAVLLASTVAAAVTPCRMPRSS